MLFRQVITEVLGELDHVEVVGTASNGSIGLKKAEQLQPDVVTLDVEMPVLDGLQTLPQLKEACPNSEVVMISSLTKTGASATIQALGNGAFDFIEKPDEEDPSVSEEMLRRQLKRIINILVTRKILSSNGRANFKKKETAPSKPREEKASTKHKVETPVRSKVETPVRSRRSETKPKESTEAVLERIQALHGHSKVSAIGIGVSTGGPAALPTLFENMPKDLNVPIFVVQHMPPLFVSALVESLNKCSSLPVVEAKNEEVPQKNTIYLAPGGKQMKVLTKAGGEYVIILTDDPPENYCKPAVDYLFRSLAETFKNNVLGIIMTGMGKDGVGGAKLMKAQGAPILTQDQASSVVYGMAMEAVKAGVVDEVLPLSDLASAIEKRVKNK